MLPCGTPGRVSDKVWKILTHAVSTASQIAFKPSPQASMDTHWHSAIWQVAGYAGPYQKPSGNLGMLCLLDDHEKLLHK